MKTYYYETQYPNYLMHFGVKGMKWGVRRYQNEDGTLTDRGKRQYVKTNGNLTRKGKRLRQRYGKITEAAGAAMRKDPRYTSLYVDAWNSAADDVDRYNDKVKKKYGTSYYRTKEYDDTVHKISDDAFDKYYTKYYNERIPAIVKDTPQFREGVEFANKYNMTEWDDLARNNNKQYYELLKRSKNKQSLLI